MKTKQDFPSINERPPEGLKDDGSKVRVLIVDDSMFVAKQLGQILTSEGYEVVATAADGQEGVDKYKDQSVVPFILNVISPTCPSSAVFNIRREIGRASCRERV